MCGARGRDREGVIRRSRPRLLKLSILGLIDIWPRRRRFKIQHAAPPAVGRRSWPCSKRRPTSCVILGGDLLLEFALIEDPQGGTTAAPPPLEDLGATLQGHRNSATESRLSVAWQVLGRSRQDLGKFLAFQIRF